MRVLLGCALWLMVLSARAEWFYDQQPIMGTDINLSFWHQDATKAESIKLKVMNEMRRINDVYSPYLENSALSKVNRSAAQAPQTISSEFIRLLLRAKHFSVLSDGAFDITFASLGFHYNYRNSQKPDDALVKKLLPAIDYRSVLVDEKARTVAFSHENVRIDLGGIAKGFAVDQAADILLNEGVKHATVSAGGDSRVIGDKRGKAWMIGIKNPRISKVDEREVVITLPLQDTAISTSGDYERFFIDEESGERVHHILNPKTGKPAGGVMSVTVLGERGFDTDALSTTVFVLGVEKGLALINNLHSFDAILIDDKGKVHYSDGLMAPGNNKN